MKIELTHDILAKKVGERVSLEDRRIRKAERFIQDSLESYLERGKNAYLKQDDLNYLLPFLDKISLSTEEKSFIEQSKKYNRKKKAIQIIGFSLLTLVMIGLLSFGIYQFIQYKKIQTANQGIIDEIQKMETSKKETEKRIKDTETKNEETEKKLAQKEKELKEEENRKEKMEKEMEKQTIEEKKMKEEQNKLKKSKQENEAAIKEAEEFKTGSEVKQKEFFYKMAAKEYRWSKSLGRMDWYKAKEACKQLGEGWRLPTVLEYEGVYKNKPLVEKWKEGYWYWTGDEFLVTGDEFSAERAYIFSFYYGISAYFRKVYNKQVRCIF